MSQNPARCLILACGNTLRADDGFGPWLARWAEDRFAAQSEVRIVSAHQWTPEMAEEIAAAQSVLFIDCSTHAAPGQVMLLPVQPAPELTRLLAHHLCASELLAMAATFYNAHPHSAHQLTMGAGSLELSEEFSPEVQAALPEACRLLEEAVLRLLALTV